MKNKRISTTLVLIALGLLIAPIATAQAEEAPVQRYVFNIAPKKMQGITMNYPDKLHEKHVEVLFAQGEDCTVCHYDNDEMRFMGVSANDRKMRREQKRIDFVHASCAGCHAERKQGPVITECRSCHLPEYGPETGLERVMR